ncbi:hypothetical protein [Bdellovibrio sp. NC01]|uniref:hypothetical protein n=1 Tax=Bdellovibrio sp. NC01 TaxID=2220073 RepID=UPI00115C3E52|nr:hypothetical protein [Bdellovibrio sp. NC01]QDK39387.1 hypothetical protein DOE51_18190 [Bdellovibrio sp. NC01]
MKSLALVLFGFVLTGSLAQASVCKDLKPSTSDVIFLDYDDCEFAEDLSHVFNEIKETFGGPNVTLVIGTESDNAAFDLGHMIELPYRMIFYGRYGQEYPVPRANVVTAAAHEYGHSIFHERVKKEFPQFTELAKDLANLSNVKEAYYRKQVPYSKVDEANKEIAKVTNYADFVNYLSAYSEFFADVIAVYQYDSKSAMVQALYYDAMSKEEFNYISLRDFDHEPSMRYENQLSEEHAKLAFVRAWIGKNMWPENRDQARVYADKILNAIMKLAKEDIKAGVSPEYREMNDRLIAELQK